MGANVAAGQSSHGLTGAQILARLLALGAGGAAFPDNVFEIVGSGDATKIAAFEVDGFTTGTTRTFTLPNASITVAGINLAQTWTAAQVLDLGSGANPATALSGTVLSLLNADATNVRLLGVAYGANGIIISGRGVGGTRASPTATTNGQVLCQFTGFGYNGTTYPTSSSALYAISAGSLWTASNQETLHEWRCTANGSTTNTQRMVLYGTGNLCLGSAPADDGVHNLQVAGSAIVSGAMTLSSTLAVVGAVTVAAAGATNNPLVVIGPTGAGSTEVNQALRVGNISATGKYVCIGYDSTNDYGYIAGIQAATGWKEIRINPYANAALSLNAGGGVTTIGGAVSMTAGSNSNIIQGTGWIWTSTGSSGGTIRGGIYAQSGGDLNLFGGSSITSHLAISSAGAVTITNTSATPLSVSSNQTGVTLKVVNTAAFGATNNADVEFYANNASAASVLQAYMLAMSTTTTAGAETCTLSINVREAGTAYNALQFVGRAATFLDIGTHGPSSGGATSPYLLTLQNNTAGTALRLTTNTGTIYNWIIGSEFTNANEFEITPSTLVGGTAFSAPAFRIAAAPGGTMTIPRPIAATSTLAVTGAFSGSTFSMTGGGSFGANVTVDTGTGVQSLLSLAGTGTGWSGIRLFAGTTHQGFMLAAQNAVSDAFEITPADSAGSTSFGTPAFLVFANGSTVLGPRSALATNATDGFAYFPSCAGTPTGAPTARTGKVAWCYDTTNNIIYIYNGAWKKTVALT